MLSRCSHGEPKVPLRNYPSTESKRIESGVVIVTVDIGCRVFIFLFFCLFRLCFPFFPFYLWLFFVFFCTLAMRIRKGGQLSPVSDRVVLCCVCELGRKLDQTKL